ncbi:hypothetical protein [Geobacter sp.]|uniref:hypothetical protein n=1 Tax=Geobacter sp. TaxID=46610 RepID=UPI002625E45F|nr:hypothetical protein [Geobacter sp.]
MFKRFVMPGFTELDRQIAKLQELRDSFRQANHARIEILPQKHAFFPTATEL